MAAVEEILWNIFTFYSLNGNPKDPSRLQSTALVKLCKDVMIMDNSMTEKPISQPEILLIYTSATKSPEKARIVTKEKSDKIDFEGFLSCIIKISNKCYPSAGSQEASMQQLLMDNILPMASTRKPVSIAALLRQPVIENIFKYYEDALLEIFRFYTTSSDYSQKVKNMIKSTSKIGQTFDDTKESIQNTKQKASNKESTSNKMAYADFLRFANDFGLISGLGITTLDLGDIFLTVSYFNNFSPILRKIDFREYWEALVRCALVAYQDKKKLSTETKVKGLFLAMWRHIQASVQDHMNGYGTLQGGGFNTYKGTLLRGSQLLNDRFVAAWTKDNYCDYVQSSVAPTKAKAFESVTISANKTKDQAPLSPQPNVISRLLKASVGDKGTPQPPPSSSSKKLQSSNALLSITQESADDKLFHIAHDSVAQSDNFLIKTADGGSLRIKIDDNEIFEDPRLTSSDLRVLFYNKPALAELIYDAMIDAGIVSEPIMKTQSQNDINDSESDPFNMDGLIDDMVDDIDLSDEQVFEDTVNTE